jgi:hypothetical protein
VRWPPCGPVRKHRAAQCRRVNRPARRRPESRLKPTAAFTRHAFRHSYDHARGRVDCGSRPTRPAPMKHPLACALALALAAGRPSRPRRRPPARNRRVDPQRRQPVLRRQHAAAALPDFAKIKDTDFAPAFDQGMAEDWRKSKRSPTIRPSRPSTTPSSRWKRAAARCRARHRVLQPAGRRQERRAREDRRAVLAEVRRAPRRDPPEPQAVRAHQVAVRPPRPSASTRSRRAWSSVLHRLRARRRQPQRRRQDQAEGHQRPARHAGHAVRPEAVAGRNAAAVVVDTRAELDGLTDAQIDAAAEAPSSASSKASTSSPSSTPPASRRPRS